MIFALIGNEESVALELLKSVLEGTFDILDYESVDQVDDISEIDFLVMDYDSDPKINKSLKKVKKLYPEVGLILLSNKLSSKELIKHQNSKLAADIYLRTPVELNAILRLLDLEQVSDNELSEESIETEGSSLTSEQKEIIVAHMPGHEIGFEAKVLSDEIQELFDEVYTPRNFLTQEATKTLRNVSVETPEIELEDDGLTLESFDLEEELPDLPPMTPVENEVEEIEMSQKSNELDLDDDLGLDLSSDDTESSLSLVDEDFTDDLAEDSLSLDSGVSELDLSDDSLDLSLDDDLSFGEGDLESDSLDLNESLDLDDSMDLALDSGVSELDLGGEDASLDLSLSDAEEGLDSDFSLESSDDDSLDLGLDEDELSFGEDGPSAELEMPSDDLDLSTDLDLGEEEDSLDFGALSVDEEPQIETALDDSDAADDGLDLFGELPSSPEIDALNLDAEDAEAESDLALSEDALRKLKEIDDLMNEDIDDSQDESYAFASDDEAVVSTEEDEVTAPSEKVASYSNTPLRAEHAEVVEHHHQELDRLGITLSEMRKDRNHLLEEMEKIKGQMETQKREMLTMRSELDEKKIENTVIRKRYEKQVEDLKFQLDLSNEKKSLLEEKNKEFEKEYQKLNQKVRIDIKKIQTREKELEGQIELLRADSEIQVKNRDQKILELKRKIDTLEFDLESVQVNEKRNISSKHDLEDKMERVIKTLRVAIGELEDGEADVRTLEKIKKSLDV